MKDFLKWIIVSLVLFAGFIFVLGIGIKIGSEKANFSCMWAGNYRNNFAGPRQGVVDNVKDFPAQSFMSGHGVFGKIIETDDDSIVIKTDSDYERLILVDKNTIIKLVQENVSFKDLKVDQNVVIIGGPGSTGEIVAKLIRVIVQ